MRKRKSSGRSGGSKRDKLYGKRAKHNVPDEFDELLRQEELARLGKKLDGVGRPTPLTERQLVAICVKAIREKWMSCDSKLHFLLSKQEWDTNPNTRTTKLWTCNQCKDKFKLSDINVDHIRASGECTSLEQLVGWAESQLNSGGDEDLQILCIDCHSIKNVMDVKGITDWAEGEKVKKLIALLALKANEQKELLAEHGYTGSQVSNKEKREKCFTRLLEEGKIT